MKALTNLFRTVEQVVTADERFNSASALSAYALSTFDRVVDDLGEANEALLIVEAEVLAEIDRLNDLVGATFAQRSKNETVIGKVRALVS